jgi:hypothetical protein
MGKNTERDIIQPMSLPNQNHLWREFLKTKLCF